ncbi:MAG: response regulator transcription factor [Bacteriovoracaceae bacterium]
MDKIVIIEDEKEVGEMLKFLLEKNSFNVDFYPSAEDFFLAKKFYSTCVYIIDSNLPGIQGEDVIRTIRSKDKLSPVFIISGNTEGEDISHGLACGADDYLPKPFNTDHLLQKVRNSVEKTKIVLDNMMNVGIKLIPEAHSILIDGTTVNLTQREFTIIERLLKTPGDIVTREELVSDFDDSEVTVRTIDVHVSSLRKKLEKIKLSIETVRGKGYKIQS